MVHSSDKDQMRLSFLRGYFCANNIREKIYWAEQDEGNKLKPAVAVDAIIDAL